MAVEGMKCLYLFIAGNICNCLKLAGILSGRKMDINGKGKMKYPKLQGVGWNTLVRKEIIKTLEKDMA